MKNNGTYKYVLALPLMALVAFGAYAFGMANVQSEGGVPQDMGYTGAVNVKQIRDGVVLREETNHNILFLNGKNITTTQIFGKPWAISASGFLITNISLGNGTVAPSQTSTLANFGGIATCGLAPYQGASFAWIPVQNATAGYIDASGNVSANYQWTSTCEAGATGLQVNQTMIGNATAVAGLPFAATTFTNVFLQNGDKLNVTWYVWIT